MNIELTGEEQALLISALTTKISKLRAQSELHHEQDMPHWADRCDAEIDQLVALKERLFK